MKASTSTTIMNIRHNYRFGVEIEMNHITRQKAAEVVANYYGTDRVENTAATNGYMTISAYDDAGREWKCQRDVSIMGPDDEKCELVTPVLEYRDIPHLQEIVRRLRKAGAISNPENGCGVHIHVSKVDGFTPTAIRNLVNIMAAHEEQIGRAIRISEHRTETYCRVIDKGFLAEMQKRKPATMEEIEDIWYKSHHTDNHRSFHYNDSRYHMLNLHSFFHGHGTIEFRLFQFANPRFGKKGGLHAGELKSYIQLCIGICERASQVKWASAKPQQTDNEAYAFRCWLLALGFIGDEFATARQILLRNLEGDPAWRNA